MSVYKYCNLLLMMLLMVACDNKAEKKIVEKVIPLFFTIVGDIEPHKESQDSALVKSSNHLSVTTDQKGNLGNMEETITPDSSKVPVYQDISFFPVENKDQLNKMCISAYTKRDNKDSIATIDFNKYFILIVTHPPENSYDDILSEKISNDTLHLSLTSTVIRGTENVEILKYVWVTGAYRVKRGNVISVEHLGENTFFSINRG